MGFTLTRPEFDATNRRLLDYWGITPQPKGPTDVVNFGRVELAKMLFELGLRRGVEIGVQKGEYTEVLAKAGLDVTGIDPWLVRPDSHPEQGYHDHRSQEVFDGYYAAAKRRLAKYPNARLIRDFSLPVARRMYEAILDGAYPLDFAYIDGHHSFQAVTNDICEWSKVVRPGGIIAGHDYAVYPVGSDMAVLQVTNAYAWTYRIQPWFILGRKDKIEGEVRDRHRTFLWARPDDKAPGDRHAI